MSGSIDDVLRGFERTSDQIRSSLAELLSKMDELSQQGRDLEAQVRELSEEISSRNALLRQTERALKDADKQLQRTESKLEEFVRRRDEIQTLFSIDCGSLFVWPVIRDMTEPEFESLMGALGSLSKVIGSAESASWVRRIIGGSQQQVQDLVDAIVWAQVECFRRTEDALPRSSPLGDPERHSEVLSKQLQLQEKVNSLETNLRVVWGGLTRNLGAVMSERD